MSEGISPDTYNVPGSPSSTGEVTAAGVAAYVISVHRDFLLQIKKLKFGGLNDVVSQVRAATLDGDREEANYDRATTKIE